MLHDLIPQAVGGSLDIPWNRHRAAEHQYSTKGEETNAAPFPNEAKRGDRHGNNQPEGGPAAYAGRGWLEGESSKRDQPNEPQHGKNSAETETGC